MALVNNSSYIPTTTEFLAHWAAVDVAVVGGFALPGLPGVIPPSLNRSGLVVFRDTLLADLQDVQDKLNDVEIASGRIRILKEKLYARFNLFLAVVDGYYQDSEFASARPEAPGITAGGDRFLDPMRDARSLWGRMNAAPAPAGLELPIVVKAGSPEMPDDVSLAAFTSMLSLLVQRMEEHGQAVQALTLSRARRDKTMKVIRALLVQYRATVVVAIAGNEPLLSALPRVTPEPGHTPDAVFVTTTFTAPNKATGEHTESGDADFDDYQIVAAIGEEATLEDSIVLETRSARTPAPFETTLGLGAPGGAVSLWVIVRTTDGNERASAKSVVRRPDAG